MSFVEDAILTPFVGHLMKAASVRGVDTTLLEIAIYDALFEMRNDEASKSMEQALSGQVAPAPIFKVADNIAIYHLADPTNPPLLAERVGFSADGKVVRLKDARRSYGSVLSIEPNGHTVQVILDRRL